MCSKNLCGPCGIFINYLLATFVWELFLKLWLQWGEKGRLQIQQTTSRRCCDSFCQDFCWQTWVKNSWIIQVIWKRCRIFKHDPPNRLVEDWRWDKHMKTITLHILYSSKARSLTLDLQHCRFSWSPVWHGARSLARAFIDGGTAQVARQEWGGVRGVRRI